MGTGWLSPGLEHRAPKPRPCDRRPSLRWKGTGRRGHEPGAREEGPLGLPRTLATVMATLVNASGKNHKSEA